MSMRLRFAQYSRTTHMLIGWTIMPKERVSDTVHSITHPWMSWHYRDATVALFSFLTLSIGWFRADVAHNETLLSQQLRLYVSQIHDANQLNVHRHYRRLHVVIDLSTKMSSYIVRIQLLPIILPYCHRRSTTSSPTYYIRVSFRFRANQSSKSLRVLVRIFCF